MGLQTRLNRPSARDSESEAQAREEHGKGDEAVDEAEIQVVEAQLAKAAKWRKGKSNDDPGDEGGDGSSNESSCDTGDDSSDLTQSSDESDASSRASLRPSIQKSRRKRIKLDLRYLKRATKTAEAKGQSKHLRRTNKLLNNWSQDFKEVVRRFDLCPSRPEFPLGELKNILGGRFVNLDAVLTYHYSSNLPEKRTEKLGDLEFTFTPSTFACLVESASDWITAWGRTERAY